MNAWPSIRRRTSEGVRGAVVLCVSSIVAVAITACGGKVAGAHLRDLGDEPNIEAPELAGTDHLGRHVTLHDSLANGPVVLVFYRGHW